MRKSISLLLACLLAALCFACGQKEISASAEEEESVTTTETAAAADETIAETMEETTSEPTTEASTTAAKPTATKPAAAATQKPTTRGPSVQEILDSGVYTLRMRTEQGPAVIVSDGNR